MSAIAAVGSAVQRISRDAAGERPVALRELEPAADALPARRRLDREPAGVQLAVRGRHGVGEPDSSRPSANAPSASPPHSAVVCISHGGIASRSLKAERAGEELGAGAELRGHAPRGR